MMNTALLAEGRRHFFAFRQRVVPVWRATCRRAEAGGHSGSIGF
jgi:hypothetical protein